MITLSGVEKAHGGRILFGDVSLQINRGDRLGLVGPNGAGKTTLFNIILDEESTDAGTVDLQRNLDLGFLPQESLPVNDETVLELALSVRPGFLEARKQILNGEHVEAETYELYNDAGGGQLEAKAKRILGGLSFRTSDFDRPASEMSGGWVMRAHLARLLVQEPDLLMLDEPTNHLDLEALIWVQGYLKSYPGAILMISHDREFLNQLVHGILELRREQLFRWTGNYDSFLQQRDAHESQQLAAHKNQQRQIDHLQTFVNRFGAKNTKATQAKSKQKQIDRLKADLVNAPQGEDRRMKGFHFPQPERSGQRVLTLKGIDFAYGNNTVYTGMDCEVERGQRTVLVGPNGAGKSTLLQAVGLLEGGFGGEIVIAGPSAEKSNSRARTALRRDHLGFVYQFHHLLPEFTALENVMMPQLLAGIGRKQAAERARECLAQLGLAKRTDHKPAELSGGERQRTAIARALVNRPGLVLLDEPTGNLDEQTARQVEDAMLALAQDSDTAFVMVTHDRALAGRMDRCLLLAEQSLNPL